LEKQAIPIRGEEKKQQQPYHIIATNLSNIVYTLQWYFSLP
jgi:hypothetical protein